MPSRRAESSAMTRSVKPSQPLPACEAGAPGTDGEHAVEQEHAALGPRRQVAGARHRQAEVGPELGEDVAERRGWSHARRNGEREPHRLPAAVVGILPENHDANAVERRQPQRVEDERTGRVEAAPGRDLGREKRPQVLHRRGLELVAEGLEPPCRPSAVSHVCFPSWGGGFDHTIAAPRRPPAGALNRYA